MENNVLWSENWEDRMRSTKGTSPPKITRSRPEVLLDSISFWFQWYAEVTLHTYTGAVTYFRVSWVTCTVIASLCVDTILITTCSVQQAFIDIWEERKRISCTMFYILATPRTHARTHKNTTHELQRVLSEGKVLSYTARVGWWLLAVLTIYQN